MRRLIGGEATAFEELFATYWNGLALYAERMLEDRAAAADVVQEVLTGMWVRRGELDPSTSLRAFLYRATRNAVIDSLRRREVRARWARSQAGREAAVSETPEDVLWADELRTAAETAIQALPARRREVFILAHLHNMTYAEIGALVGIAPQTVANHMSLALADLRRSLQAFLPAGPLRRGPIPTDPGS